MTRNRICSAGFFASVVVVLVTVLSGCTDPNNTAQVNDPYTARARDPEYRTGAR
jgi:hypothetical protein